MHSSLHVAEHKAYDPRVIQAAAARTRRWGHPVWSEFKATGDSTSAIFFCEQLGVEMRSHTRAGRTIWRLAHQISQLQPGLSLTLYLSLFSRSTLSRVISSSQGLHQICSQHIISRKGKLGAVSSIFLLFLKLPVILV